ncbi:uncharacterized protein Z518_10384 [Rhinocladiella mackenziei CBS 650.93]|uniref:Rhinocladiella mackenziei CBS 650.93 unplaced genomic scaffold supercont1.9, whole genome shotgun sequence n=1 Tax=Rhinocladiella mackenziei CBS 650.93 TaxID=1442369 RepID=A0A0D2IU23_9EURO|nr:uncharacterized protein Z518_10384 [Rhinocladiella mackenziei CBS 650.93]KIX00245.1 hypothetical protein Z518_10384 [Rhinocladiella mackenziei CBS 650.93]
MAGTKRTYDGMEIDPYSSSPGENASPFILMFESFRSELDEHHDRRERIIKVSRDVTAQSKKIIFALQRVRELGRPIHASISKQMTPMYSTIRDLLQRIVPDLQGINAHRYQSNISGGIQEFMEAVLFEHYLTTQRVMSFGNAAKQLPEGIALTYEDYTLGLFDMTGELMRFAITYMATNGQLPGAKANNPNSSILNNMQLLRIGLEGLDPSGSYGLSRDFAQKLKTAKNSIEKVENGVYSMIVRGKERPKGWRPDTSLADAPREEE